MEAAASHPGRNKFSRLKESNTQVLAQTVGGDPILVAGQYVAGRVLALAVDSTSPWYRYGFHTEHKRFWRQAILWLARKDDALGDGVWAKLEQRRLYRGERIAFTAGATGADAQPLTDVVLEAKVVGPQGAETPARLSPDGQQWAGTLEPMATPGDYLLEVVGRRDGQDVGSARAELHRPGSGPGTERPGGQSAAAGAAGPADQGRRGQIPGPRAATRIAETDRRAPPKMEIEVQSEWQLADTELDAWLFFLCVVGLLSGEWYLRKKWRWFRRAR